MKNDLITLEFDKVLTEAASFATTSMAQELLQKVAPFYTPIEIQTAHDETKAAWLCLQRLGMLNVEDLTNTTMITKRLKAEGMLSGLDFRALAMHYSAAKKAIAYYNRLTQLPERPTTLDSFFQQIRYQESLFTILMSTVDESGNFLDTASIELSRIRRQITTIHKQIQEQVQKALSTYSKYISDAIVTKRNDRFVIPVKAEAKHLVKGNVQDVSSSGETFFIEPESVMALENTMREWIRKEADEIDAICKALSIQLAPFADEIEYNQVMMTHLDVLFAKAHYGILHDCVPVQFGDHIRLLQARHPLLNKDTVVANDIYFDGVQAILITGPNTGGKTVAIKTFGLLSVMAQSGFLLPVNEGSQTIYFDSVFADIGDEQSIEQSLSTFSSHMNNIIRIMNESSPKSLVLLDELGSGTDPKEGAALAIAIAEFFLDKGVTLLATTHYSELKGFASIDPRVTNASTEFNVETLSPTYQLSIGLPGASNAVAIARKLGMDASVLTKATKGTASEEQHLASLTEELKQAKARYESLNNEMLSQQQELELTQESLAQKVQGIETQRLHFEKEKQQIIQDEIKQLKAELDAVVKELKASSTIKHHEVLEAKARLEERLPESASSSPQILKYQPQESVYVATYNQSAVVNKVLPNNQYQIQMGILTLSVHASELRKQTQEEKKPKSVMKYQAKTVKAELDIRGVRFEEAMIEVEKYLDDILTGTLKQARIIHGFGTHALRQGVQELLKRQTGVDHFHYGEPAEGGQGVTVVHFK